MLPVRSFACVYFLSRPESTASIRFYTSCSSLPLYSFQGSLAAVLSGNRSYLTTSVRACQHFFQSFLKIFCVDRLNVLLLRFNPSFPSGRDLVYQSDNPFSTDLCNFFQVIVRIYRLFFNLFRQNERFCIKRGILTLCTSRSFLI